jgi:chorismate dehydratase
MVSGPQRGLLDLRFEIPSVCAALLKSGEVDIGLVPAVELERQPLEIITGQGIASNGPVASILLISKVPPAQIQTLAADSSSRTSVVLAQIWLREKFGSAPKISSHAPDVAAMLAQADACLVIGDPALRVNVPAIDLGAEWTELTGLPFVYAVWAARTGFDAAYAAGVLDASWQYGKPRIETIARAEAPKHGVTEDLAVRYLLRNIRFEIDQDARKGLDLFRSLARSLGLV